MKLLTMGFDKLSPNGLEPFALSLSKGSTVGKGAGP